MVERICVVVGPPPAAGGGIAAVTEALVNSQIPGERGWRVDVLDSGGGRGVSGYRAFPTALRNLNSTSADLLHFQVASKGSTLRKAALAEIARRRGIPYVIHLHAGGYEDFLTGLGPRRHRSVRRFFLGARDVIVLGKVWHELLATELGLPPGLMRIVDNGVPGVETPPNPGHRIVFVGVLTYYKGVDVLLEAAKSVLTEHPTWHLDLVGPTPVPALVERARTQAEAVGGRITLHGRLGSEERDRLYADAAIFVLPSRAEGLPLVMLEAMSAHLAPVVGDVGAVSEVIEDQQNGLLVPPEEVEALHRALSFLIENPEQRSAIAERAYETWQERFQVDGMVDHIVKTWDRASGQAVASTFRDLPLVSVVIPTVGRQSLALAVGSALAQEVPVDVVVVNDSGRDLALDLPTEVRVLDTAGRRGAAAARNVGMRHARGELIAFLDDDDCWLPGHLLDAVATLDRRKDADIYAARGTVVQPDGSTRVEPVELLGERTVACYFFGPTAWFSRNRRLMTPTLVFRRSLIDLDMDTTLTSSEDTWWLLSAQHERRAVLVQSAHLGVRVHASPARDEARRVQRDDAAWVARLESVAPGAGAGYIVEIGRERCRRGDIGGVKALVSPLLKQPTGRRWLPVLAVQASVATGMRARQGLKRGI